MRFKSLPALALLAALAAVSTHSIAAPDASNVYVAVEAGTSHLSGTDEDARKASFDATFGAQLNRNIALETTYKRLGARLEMDFDIYSFSAVGSLPVARSVDLVAKLGVAHTAVTASGDGISLGLTHVGPVGGVGVDYRFDRNWSVRAMFEAYPDFGGLDERMTNFSLGVKYAF